MLAQQEGSNADLGQYPNKACADDENERRVGLPRQAQGSARVTQARYDEHGKNGKPEAANR